MRVYVHSQHFFNILLLEEIPRRRLMGTGAIVIITPASCVVSLKIFLFLRRFFRNRPDISLNLWQVEASLFLTSISQMCRFSLLRLNGNSSPIPFYSKTKQKRSEKPCLKHSNILSNPASYNTSHALARNDFSISQLLNFKCKKTCSQWTQTRSTCQLSSSTCKRRRGNRVEDEAHLWVCDSMLAFVPVMARGSPPTWVL